MGIGLLWEKELWRKWKREELGFIVGEGKGVDAGKVVKGDSSFGFLRIVCLNFRLYFLIYFTF